MKTKYKAAIVLGSLLFVAVFKENLSTYRLPDFKIVASNNQVAVATVAREQAQANEGTKQLVPSDNPALLENAPINDEQGTNVASDSRTFYEWTQTYRLYKDNELKLRFDEIDKAIGDANLIEKANKGLLSAKESATLRQLLREQNAVSAIQMERLSEDLERGEGT